MWPLGSAELGYNSKYSFKPFDWKYRGLLWSAASASASAPNRKDNGYFLIKPLHSKLPVLCWMFLPLTRAFAVFCIVYHCVFIGEAFRSISWTWTYILSKNYCFKFGGFFFLNLKVFLFCILKKPVIYQLYILVTEKSLRKPLAWWVIVSCHLQKCSQQNAAITFGKSYCFQTLE